MVYRCRQTERLLILPDDAVSGFRGSKFQVDCRPAGPPDAAGLSDYISTLFKSRDVSKALESRRKTRRRQRNEWLRQMRDLEDAQSQAVDWAEMFDHGHASTVIRLSSRLANHENLMAFMEYAMEARVRSSLSEVFWMR